MKKSGAKAKSPAKSKIKKDATSGSGEMDLFSLITPPAITSSAEPTNTQLVIIYDELLKIRLELQAAAN